MFYYFSLVGLVLGTLVAECSMFAVYYFAIKITKKLLWNASQLFKKSRSHYNIPEHHNLFLELFPEYSNTLFVSSGIFITINNISDKI